jgi:ABC-type multidrug transport system fused ATPase/permease subunit
MGLSFLKPNKANIIGTVLLLIVNLAASTLSQSITQIFIPGMSGMVGNGGEFAGPSGVQFNRTGRQINPDGAQFDTENMQFGDMGMTTNRLLSSGINILVLALLFYVVISFVMEFLAKGSKDKISTEKTKQTRA